MAAQAARLQCTCSLLRRPSWLGHNLGRFTYDLLQQFKLGFDVNSGSALVFSLTTSLLIPFGELPRGLEPILRRNKKVS